MKTRHFDPDSMNQNGNSRWNSGSKAAKKLKCFLTDGTVTPTMRPKDIQALHPSFSAYSTTCFRSAVNRLKRSVGFHVRGKFSFLSSMCVYGAQLSWSTLLQLVVTWFLQQNYSFKLQTTTFPINMLQETLTILQMKMSILLLAWVESLLQSFHHLVLPLMEVVHIILLLVWAWDIPATKQLLQMQDTKITGIQSLWRQSRRTSLITITSICLLSFLPV